MQIFYNDSSSLEEVASLVQKGCVGVIPADTIYGISALADDKTAERIYEIKKRPANKSFIMLADIDYLRNGGFYDVPDRLYELWPCSLTAILMGRDGKTQAVRVPSDEYILSLVKKTGPIWSTSVNISGMANLNHADDIIARFQADLDFIVRKKAEGENSLPSTLVDCTQKPYRVLRQGAFDASVLSD